MTSILVTRGLKVSATGDFYFRRYLRNTPNESLVRVNFGDLEKFVSSLDEDLAYIAASLFNYEKFLKDEGHPPVDKISIGARVASKLGNAEVEGILHDVLSFCLKADAEIKIVQATASPLTPVKMRDEFGCVSLFSGGLDSLSGIGAAKEKFGSAHGVFVHHDGLGGIVETVENKYLRASKMHVHNVGTQTGPKGLQQMRGFLYMIFGGIAANIHNSRNIVISEVGHTMFQPELTALDEVTLTTHPILVRLAKDLLRQAYGQDYVFYEPFSNLTKSEAIALCPVKEAIPITNSCRTTRWAYSPVSHCGQCYGCLVRRMSCLVAGVDDATYAADVLVNGIGDEIIGRQHGSTINVDDFDNLYGLLRFARDILEGKLDDTATFKIGAFSRQDLYRRFALDMMSALYILYESGGIGHNKWVQKFYQECVQDDIVTPDMAQGRIDEVRSMKHQPNFDLRI